MMSEVTEETLPTGEQVKCYPDGRTVLTARTSPLRALLDECSGQRCSQHDALKADLAQRLHRAQDALDAGDPVPHEKRVI